MSEEKLPCIRCEGDGKLIEHTLWYYFVQFQRCRLRTGYSGTEKEAIDDWNTRPEPDTKFTELLAAAKEAMGEDCPNIIGSMACGSINTSTDVYCSECLRFRLKKEVFRKKDE